MRPALTNTVLSSTSFAEDVRHSLRLTPRQLPSRYLYDSVGSALFEAICELPWYGITRAETRLLANHRGDIFRQLPGLTRIVELGPGNGRKLQTIVEGTSLPITAHLIDVSPAALIRAAQTLSDAAHVTVVTHEAPFEHGLDQLAQLSPTDDRPLLLFLGSNIGNFDPPQSVSLLRRMQASLGRGGALLLGVDLVKPERDLLLAYDDPLGVSAAFNLNLLLRINRELGGNFDLSAFCHRAVWNAVCSRMEMYLVSTGTQLVQIEAIDIRLELSDGEVIWTESSYKYTVDGIMRLLDNVGFEPVAHWIDREDAFALMLARAT